MFLKSSNIQSVCSWYKKSFAEIRQCDPPTTKETENKFEKVVESIYERHAPTLITMARGAHEIRLQLKQDVNTFADYDEIQSRLDDFYMNRIGIRMLIGQYLALKKPSTGPDMIGLIHKRCSPREAAAQAIETASYQCNRVYGDAPEVSLHGRTDLTFPYVPSHLNYMLQELLKNSMRATVEKYGPGNPMPLIRIVIADGEDNEDVAIKISDEGGGIARSNINRVWSYLFTTADPEVLQEMLTNEDAAISRGFDIRSPLAGLGYGLPVARNYARYFGGELTLMSMEGYGTDGFIYLPRLAEGKTVLP